MVKTPASETPRLRRKFCPALWGANHSDAGICLTASRFLRAGSFLEPHLG